MKRQAAVAIVLLVFLTLEILSCSCREAATLASGSPGGITCSFEPLQVCDRGDSSLGALAYAPFVVPGAPVPFLLPAVRRRVPERASFMPDGFKPAIDHPPRLSPAGRAARVKTRKGNHINEGALT